MFPEAGDMGGLAQMGKPSMLGLTLSTSLVCQCTRIWSNVPLGVSTRAHMVEINICIVRLVKQTPPPRVGGPHPIS